MRQLMLLVSREAAIKKKGTALSSYTHRYHRPPPPQSESITHSNVYHKRLENAIDK
jgi:hypothetical protein